MTSKGDGVRAAISERYQCAMPLGAMTAMAGEFGLSRQRVHQIAREMERRVKKPDILICGRCGTNPVGHSKRGLCRTCREETSTLELVCDGCGVTFTRDTTRIIALQGGASPSKRGQYSGKIYCSKICPGRPAGFAANLTEEWTLAPDGDMKFYEAVYMFWRGRGRRVMTKKKPDGRYYRLKG